MFRVYIGSPVHYRIWFITFDSQPTRHLSRKKGGACPRTHSPVPDSNQSFFSRIIAQFAFFARPVSSALLLNFSFETNSRLNGFCCSLFVSCYSNGARARKKHLRIDWTLLPPKALVSYFEAHTAHCKTLMDFGTLGDTPHHQFLLRNLLQSEYACHFLSLYLEFQHRHYWVHLPCQSDSAILQNDHCKFSWTLLRNESLLFSDCGHLRQLRFFHHSTCIVGLRRQKISRRHCVEIRHHVLILHQ